MHIVKQFSFFREQHCESCKRRQGFKQSWVLLSPQLMNRKARICTMCAPDLERATELFRVLVNNHLAMINAMDNLPSHLKPKFKLHAVKK